MVGSDGSDVLPEEEKLRLIHLSDIKSVEYEDGEPQGECAFCGTFVKHINAGGDGWVAGAVRGGQAFLFMYCHTVECASNLWRCNCVGGGYVENYGPTCHACKVPRPVIIRAKMPASPFGEPADVATWLANEGFSDVEVEGLERYSIDD